MKRIYLAIAILAAVSVLVLGVYLGTSVQPPEQTQPKEKLVAVVNDQPITAAAFQEKYRRFVKRVNVPATDSSASARELKMGFLNRVIETQLLLQEASLRGLTVTEEELDKEISHLKEDYPKDTLNEALEGIGLKLEEWKEDRKEKLLIDKLIKKEIDSVIHVGEDEIREYYNSHKEEFQQPLQVRARQIVVATEEEANNLRARLVKGEDFAELARLHSLSPDAEKGGDLGVFAKGQMPEEFDEVVFRYREGTISKVVQSPYGFHIFKIEDRIYPRTLSLEQVRDQISSRIFQSRQEAFFKDWLDSLKEQARITIYPENLADIS
ncbi:MAG: peptidyl-prolyl cis-trans isomerase [bacterium]|nr:MAG: peptidyl-prolyl cis-trans isomerase [bacterium]